MMQVLANLGLRTRGFLNSLATSENAWARFARNTGGTFAKSFASGAGQAAGQGAAYGILNKIFAPKPQAQGKIGSPGFFENVTGLDPMMRGVRWRFKMGLAGGALGGLALGAAGVHRAQQVKDMSDQSGLDTYDTQRVERAATRNARSFDDVAMALSNMGHARREAAEGNDELRDTFRAYGITLQDLQDPTKTNLDLLQQLGRAIEGVNLSARQRQDLRDLLGRTGDKLGATLKSLSERSDAVLITPKAINNIERAVNLVKGLGTQVKAITANLVGSGVGKLAEWFAPTTTMGQYAKMWGEGARNILEWMGLAEPVENQEVDRRLAEMRAKAADRKKQPLYDDKEIKEAAEAELEARKSFKDLKFSRMLPSQQEAELFRRFYANKDIAMGLIGAKDPKSQIMQSQARSEMVNLGEQLIRMQAPMLEQADSLAQVGGFAQGAGNVAATNPVVDKIISAIGGVEKAVDNAGKNGGFP
jgi:hypothetical protein